MRIEEIIDTKGLTINEETHVINQGEGTEVEKYSKSQEQTQYTFGYKWGRQDSYDNEKVRGDTRKWLMGKYFNDDIVEMKKVFVKDSVILDAGCGASLSSEALFGSFLDEMFYLGVDISDSVEMASKRFKQYGYDMSRIWFIRSDLNRIPLKKKVDVIFSEGVLHHTDSTQKAIYNLSRHLNPGGWFLFYVYAKKGPMREFTDDYIRDYFRYKSNEETWEELKPLTSLGKALGDLRMEIDIPEDIPFLQIKKGPIDLQRFFYWNFFKCFYKDDYTLEEMNHINFDWYRPSNCHRQTPEQVKTWCDEAGLSIVRMNVEDAGITVVAKKYKE